MKKIKLIIFSIFCIGLNVCLSQALFAQLPDPPVIPPTDSNGILDSTFSSDGTGYFICKTDQGLAQCDISGKRWTFKASWQDVEKGEADLKAWLLEARIEVTAEKDGSIYACQKFNENTDRYIRILPSENGFSCEIVEKITLLPGKNITATISPDHPNLFFYTQHDGKTMDRLDIDGSLVSFEAPDNHLEFEIGAELKVVQGKLSRHIDFSANRTTAEGTAWEIQDMPQFPGTYRWYLSLRSGDNAQPLTLTLKKGRPVPQLLNGDAVGGLLVKNVPYGAATAIPEYDDETIYPGFYGREQVGDVTPSGEALFWLPPGMYAIHVAPDLEKEDVSLLKSHFIPVEPGKMTFVEWPKSLNDAFAQGQKGKMKILSSGADEKKASLTISMLGTDRTRVVPDMKNLTVAEAGQNVRLVSVERVNTPADVVLLLDSSGSMHDQMAAALNATRKFITQLPGDTRIQVVDFDTRARPLKGNTPKEVLDSLKSVKANGATALYDSILLGLDRLSKEDRPALLVFTDGVDANHDDTGPGSNATQEEVITAVSASGIPVFTIGFGTRPDVNTLSRIADMSGGEYYVAPDEETLSRVFSQIGSNLGSQYKIDYERPETLGATNRPVISIMVDNSGSMDSWPDECTGCDKRMEKTRQILRKFVESLPDDFLIQVSSFSGDVIVEQVLTDQKQAALRGIAQMAGRSTTEILASMNMSFRTLQSVPSTRRYLVYLADAALDVDDDQKESFDAILGKIKDSSISTLFIGMVDEEDQAAFEAAAQKTNGRFVVSKDFDTLSETFSELSQEILGAPKESNTSILRVVMTHRDKNGENQIFSAAKEVIFPLKAASDLIAAPEQIVFRQGEPLMPYDPELSGLVSGTDIMMKDVRVIKRLPLDLVAKNKACAVHLKEALSFSRFRGIEAPEKFRFFALTMELENILPVQKVAIYPDGANHPAAWVAGGDKPVKYEDRVPTYLIPDVRNHFFLRWNNQRSFPVSQVTWLAQEPLTVPGDEALAVESGKKIKGTLMFMVPSDHMQQSSLHLYDTNYGHIDIPVSGILKQDQARVESLPKKDPARLSDAFSFSVTGVEPRRVIEKSETREDTTYVIVEGQFKSNMQAHLDLDPRQRFSLKLPDRTGSLFLPLHPATTLLPLGFFKPALVTPGALNPVRMVFNVPKALMDNLTSASIVIDISGGGVEVPLYEKNPSPDLLAEPDGTNGEVAVKILASGPLSPDADIHLGDTVFVVKAAIQDVKDHSHTQVGELIVLKNKNFDPEIARKTEDDLEKLRMQAATLPNRGLANFGQTTLKVIPGMLAPLPCEETVIGGLDEESIVQDGYTRAGVFFFALPEGTTPQDWEISSLVIPKLAVQTGTDDYMDDAFFAKHSYFENETGTAFQEAVEAKLSEIMAQRDASGFEKQGRVISKSVRPGEGDNHGQRVPALSLCASGQKEFLALKTLSDLQKRLLSIRFLPSGAYDSWIRQYRPEAVLSQNFGTENDLAYMAEKVLTRQGFATVRTQVDVTDTGRKALAELAGMDACGLKVLPAIRYVDLEGRDHTLVSPFLKDTGSLKNLVIKTPGFEARDEITEKADIRISLLMESTGNSAQQQLSKMADILGGSEGGGYSMTVFNESFDIDALSSDAVDIGYTIAPVNGALSYQAVVDTPVGRFRSDPENSVSTKDFEVIGEIITITTPEKTLTRKRMLTKNEKITGVFHTLGINLPDLSSGHARTLALSSRQKQDAITGKPDPLSALKWYTRGILARFLSAQTQYETALAQNLELTIGRARTYRCIMVNVIKADDDSPLSTHMDLLSPHNLVHNSREDMATRAFNIMSGMAGAQFEAAALGKNGTGLSDIWQKTPEHTALMGVDSSNLEDFLTLLEARNYPDTLTEYFRNLGYDKLVMFPSSPALINDRLRWAWLEFDKKTYQVVSVLDTGENGSMVENVIGNPVEQAGQYMVGVLVGVDVSLWSVAAFSLELDDYKQILKQAQKFAQGMGDNFGVGAKMGKAAMGIDIGGAPAAGYGRIGKVEISPTEFKATNNLMGFGNGYNDGVAYYFQNAQ